MTKNDRLVILKFIHLHRMINKEAEALGIKSNDAQFFREHPDFPVWNKLRLQVKKLDSKWLDEYIDPRS